MPVLNDGEIKNSFNCNRLEGQVEELTNAVAELQKQTAGTSAAITDVNLSLGDISVTYDTADGVHMTSTGQITYEGKEEKDQPVIDLTIPIVAGDGISIDKKENSEQIEIKAVGGGTKHLWLHSISISQSARTFNFSLLLPTDTKFTTYAAFKTWMLNNIYLQQPGTEIDICYTDRTIKVPCYTSYTVSSFSTIVYGMIIGLSGGNAASNWGMWYESKNLVAPSGGGNVSENYLSSVKILGSSTFTDSVVPIL
nr:MAG TPA: hypothetical protein [Herelleviridae sp.]